MHPVPQPSMTMDSSSDSPQDVKPDVEVLNATTSEVRAAMKQEPLRNAGMSSKYTKYTQGDLDAEHQGWHLPLGHKPSTDDQSRSAHETSTKLPKPSTTPLPHHTNASRHPQEGAQEGTGTKSMFSFNGEAASGKTPPVAAHPRSGLAYLNERNVTKKQSSTPLSAKLSTAVEVDVARTPSTNGFPLPLFPLPSTSRGFVFGPSGPARQRNQSKAFSNALKRRRLSNNDSAVANALVLARNAYRPAQAPSNGQGAALVSSEQQDDDVIIIDAPSSPGLPPAASLASSTNAEPRNVTPASAVPPKDRSLTLSFNAARGSDLLPLQTRNGQTHIVSTPAKRGRPRKPQLPRPGDQDFIGPLNRRGRRSTGEFAFDTINIAKTVRRADGEEHQDLGKPHTPYNGTKRKRDLSERPHDTYVSGPPLAAVPILVQLADGDNPPVKLHIRYRRPTRRTSTPAHNASRVLEVDCAGMSRRRASALITLFQDLVHPFIQALTTHYQGFHADADIQSIGLDVALEVLKVTLPDLIRVRRDPTTHQRTVIKRFVKELFCRKVQGYSKELGSAPPTPPGFNCLHLFKAEESPFYDLTLNSTEELNGRSSSSDVSYSHISKVGQLAERVERKVEPADTPVADVFSASTGADVTGRPRIGHQENQLSSDSESSKDSRCIASNQPADLFPVHPKHAESTYQCGLDMQRIGSVQIQSAVQIEAEESRAQLRSSAEIDEWRPAPVDTGIETLADVNSSSSWGVSRPSNQVVNVSSGHERLRGLAKKHEQQAQSLSKSISDVKDMGTAPGLTNGPAPQKSSQVGSAEHSVKENSAEAVNTLALHLGSRAHKTTHLFGPQQVVKHTDSSSPIATTTSPQSFTQDHGSVMDDTINSQASEAMPTDTFKATFTNEILDASRKMPITARDISLNGGLTQQAQEGLQSAGQIPRSTSPPNLQLNAPSPSNALVQSGYKAGTAQTSRSVKRHLAASSHTSMEPPPTVAGPANPIFDPSLELVAAGLGSTSGTTRYPYKPDCKLRVKPTDEHHTIKHADFSDLECEAIIAAIAELHGPLRDEERFRTVREKLESRVKKFDEDDLNAIVHLAHSKLELVSTRKRKSIRTFLSRAMSSAPTTPSIVRVEKAVMEPDPDLKVASLLRHRELGYQPGGRRTQQELRYAVIDNLAPVRSWKGASGDIVAAAWSPDSQTYAVGATATANAEDLQYNRPNNLLYGDINRDTLRELPDHRIPRPRPNTIASGPNSSEAVYDACDPMVYKTVAAIQFSPKGGHFYSASHDSTVKVWDLKQGIPICIETLTHSADVTVLEASKRLSQTFATASHTLTNSIRVYTQNASDSTYSHISLESSRSRHKPQHEIFTECLRWGLTPSTEHLLLAGFTRWGELPDYNPAREGDLCLWNVSTGAKLKATPSAQSIYTAAFHPFLDAFSTGGAPGLRLTHPYTTRSVVRTWDRRSGSPHSMFEYECPALDMQDLVFHPREANILAVGCTDGSIYVWDARNPDQVLHRFTHGQPIADWDHKYGDSPMTREQGDGGVNMTLWGAGKHHLYTGATDGVVKCWNINRAPEDALVRDVAQLQAGVSCGSFSPDCVTLLVGDSTGGVHILSSDPGGAGAPQEDSEMGPQAIEYIPAVRNEPPPPDNQPGQGQLAARELLQTGQLVIDPEFGIGQGPAYAGPYAAYAHEEGAPGTARLLREYEKEQPISRKGRVRDNAAARNIKGTIARRREELGGGVQGSEILDLTSDLEDVVLDKKVPKDHATWRALDGDEDDMEDDHWFPRMDEEVFAKLEGKYA